MAYGVVGVAAVQAVLAGIGMFLADIPAAAVCQLLFGAPPSSIVSTIPSTVRSIALRYFRSPEESNASAANAFESCVKKP